MRRAVIDIGTNTVKLLVADIHEGVVTVLANHDATTRLGEGVHETRQLSPGAVARTLEAVADYHRQAQTLGATDIRAFTTSAVRDATNRAEFLASVHRHCGLTVQVITGEREAELIYTGVTSDPRFTGQELLVMDVGGGSAEFIQADRRVSLPLGAVRLTEKFPDDFAGLSEHIRTALQAALTGFRSQHRSVVGTGGSIVTLAKILRDKADHVTFDEADLRALVLKLNATPLADRRCIPQLPPERADIIVAGGMIYVLALEALGAREITVSTRNLRYGALLM